MKIIVQIGVILGTCLVSELLSMIIPIPFPSSVLGIILLFLLLFFRVIDSKDIKETSGFLLQIMAIFFIPSGVGIIKYYDVIKNDIFALLIVCIITTLLTFLATAFTIRGVIALKIRFGQKKRREWDAE